MKVTAELVEKAFDIFVGNLQHLGFRYLEIPEFVAEMNRLATRDDPIYPLVDFFNRSHLKLAAMQHKLYDNQGYRQVRDRSGVGRRDTP